MSDILETINAMLGEYMGKYALYIVLGGSALVIGVVLTKIMGLRILGFGG